MSGALDGSVLVPVTVVVPTVGRLERLRACLESIASCVPGAEEVLVVDQSESDSVCRLVDGLGTPFRAIPCERRGVAHGTNVGLDAATHDAVLVTHDDCTVDARWVDVGARLLAEDSERIVTGRVLAVGDPDHVPSTIDLPDPRDYVHGVDFSVLFPNNMVVPRRAVMEIGGFDERIPFAEDNDFCYRWLAAGRHLRYDPSLVVCHHDWRSPRELERLYVDYAIGQGVFYAKHLRRGDARIARYAARDLAYGVRGLAARVLRGRPRSTDWRQGVLRGLPIGLVRGWRLFGSRGAGRTGGPG